MISLKDPEPCRHDGRSWNEAITDALLNLLDVPGNGEEVLFCMAIIFIIALVTGIGAIFEY